MISNEGAMAQPVEKTWANQCHIQRPMPARASLPVSKAYAFVFEPPPQTLGEDVVHPAAATVHRGCRPLSM